MSYQDHLNACSYCNGNNDPQKPTVRIKSVSSYRERKLFELASFIKGVSYPGILYAVKASSQLERQFKLKELVEWLKVFRKRPSIDYWYSLMTCHEFRKIYPTYVLEI